MSLDGKLRISRELPGVPVDAVPVDQWLGEQLTDRQLIVLHSDDQLERFDRHLRSLDEFEFGTIRSPNEANPVVHSVYSFAANRNFVFGFAALDEPSTSLAPDTLGFFLGVTGASEAGVEVIDTVPGAQDYYRVGHNYIASLGEDFYFIRLDPADHSPSLYRYRPGAENPGPFLVTGSAIENQTTPFLDLSNVHNYLDLQTQLDSFDGPASLTTSDGLLYLTHRAPGAAGTVWTVSTFLPQPELNTVLDLGTTALPTASANISIAQSASSVYVFEEGPYLTRNGKQEVTQTIVFPKRWIKSPRTSPLKAKSRFMTCPAIVSH